MGVLRDIQCTWLNLEANSPLRRTASFAPGRLQAQFNNQRRQNSARGIVGGYLICCTEYVSCSDRD